MLIILFFILAMSLGACNPSRHQSEPEGPKFFSLQTPASLLDVQGSLKLSEVADSVWYIPLETNENSLLGDLWAEGKMRYADGQFYIYDGQQGSICSFAADGRFLSRIGKKGQGDGEIFHFLDFTTDGETIYVCDFGNKIHRFRTDGTYLGKIQLSKQAYRIVNLDGNKLACYITDNQFTDGEEAYSWLIVNSEGDSITCVKTPRIREPNKENGNLNYFVHHDFSTEYPAAYKEAFNDSLYYFSSESEINSYAYIDLGIHKILPAMSFDEMINQQHSMRFIQIFDIPGYLIGKCPCFCIQDKSSWVVWNKHTGDFFQLQDPGGSKT